MPPHAGPTRSWNVLLAMAAVVPFLSSLQAPFMERDDAFYILANPRVLQPGLAGLWSLWSPLTSWRGEFLEYFPLRDSVYWLLWQLFGAQTLPFHIVNVCAHLVTVFIARTWMAGLGHSAAVAQGAALLFALHAGHVESVVWVSALKDPMYLGFMLLALHSYGRFSRGAGVAAWWACLGWLTLSLLCKSPAFVTPALLVALERLQKNPTPWPVVMARVLPAGMLCGAFLAHFLFIGTANGVVIPPNGGSWTTHYQLALWVYARYAQQAVLPLSNQIAYCFDTPTSLLDPRGVVGAVTLAATLAGVVLLRSRHPRAAFLVLFFPVTLLPVSNVVPFPALMADRYLYGPGLAACVLLALAVQRWCGKQQVLVMAMVCAGHGATLTARAHAWNDPVQLWQRVTEDSDCKGQPRFLLFLAHAQHGKGDVIAELTAYHDAMNSAEAFAAMPRDVQCTTHARAAWASLNLAAMTTGARHAGWLEAHCQDSLDAAIASADVAEAQQDWPALVSRLERAVRLAPELPEVTSRLQAARAAHAATTPR